MKVFYRLDDINSFFCKINERVGEEERDIERSIEIGIDIDREIYK